MEEGGNGVGVGRQSILVELEDCGAELLQRLIQDPGQTGRNMVLMTSLFLGTPSGWAQPEDRTQGTQGKQGMEASLRAHNGVDNRSGSKEKCPAHTQLKRGVSWKVLCSRSYALLDSCLLASSENNYPGHVSLSSPNH